MRDLRCVLLVAVAFLSGACGGDAAEWGGTVTDSAGVALVQNPADGDWSSQQEPQLVEELRIGSEEGEQAYQFATIVALDVDDAGRVYVLDQQAAQVRVFDSAGQHIRTLGRPGGGPGELSQATMAVLAGDNDLVYVADVMRQRIAAFGADGSEIGSTPVNIQSGIPIRLDLTPDKRFIMQTRAMTLPGMTDTVPSKDRIIVRNPASEQADTLLELESGKTISFGQGGVPQFRLFESEPMWAMLQDGRIAHGRNDVFRIEVLSPDGELERIITRPVERRPVTEADRKAFLDLMREGMERQMAAAAGGSPQVAAMVQRILEGTQFADYYPSYAVLMGGPGGTLWTQRIRTADDVQQVGGTFDARDVGSTTWDVFDGEGRLLGPIVMPERFQPLRVHGAHIYGVLRDELDVQHVVRLRVDGMTVRPLPREGN